MRALPFPVLNDQSGLTRVAIANTGISLSLRSSRKRRTKAVPASRRSTIRRTVETNDDDTLLTPSEVAAMFRVNPKTVTRWARAGKISAIRTLGGHRRFRASEIRKVLGQADYE